jgi:hypothetical protein
MARPKNADNTYAFVCKVTGETVKTNPKQFRDLAARYGVTDAELRDSYVSRNGRKVLTGEKLTVDEAVAKYGIHPNVAAKLKATVKPAPVKVETVEPVAETVETPVAETVSEPETVATPEVVEEAVTVEA